ncbi:hypothetical protein [Thermoactinomyces sp. DSM 45891]|uniref:hypothetical protein n=1 Tax=Thermoactinomyces sp. DSM 45891 TaxID=1761907 RepID=UPI0011610D1A|nr:hypothetical protein [Thermoactinomyces sp. DSM 45891]
MLGLNDALTGTFTVHNHGNSAAENVVLHVQIPSHVRVSTIVIIRVGPSSK